MSLTEIKIINEDGSQSSENLDLTKTLDSIRKKLEKENKIDDKISFSQKFNGELVEITRGNEEDFILNDIIENDSKKLYLKKATTTCWKFLNKLHKLNWGWTISPKELKRANEPAFILQSAEIHEMDEMETTKDGKNVGIKVSYKDNLFFISDNNVQDFAELLEINSKNTQSFKVYEKARFEICKLKVTREFNKTVEDATGKDAINIQKFEKIIEKYGQFIPTIIIFGQTIDEKGGNYCRDWNCIEFLKPKSIFHFVDDSLRKKIYSFFGKRILHSEITSVDNNNNNDDDDDDDDIGIKDNNITKTIKLPKSVSGIFSNKYADCSIFATVVGGVGAKSYYHCQILNSSGKEPKLMIQCLKVPNDNKLLVGWIVVGYDTYLKSIFSNNKDMQLNVLKEECKPDNNPIKLDLSKLGLSNATQHYCIGIPIINTNNIINKSDLLIGHHFSDGYNELYTFAYSLRDKKPVELPTSNFEVLVISNVQNHDSLFKEKLNDDIINFDNIDKACKNLPKFISLCSNKSENSDILLKQRLTQIKVRPLNSSLSHNFSYFSYLLFIPFKSDDCDDSVSKSQKPGILDRFKINNATNKSSATEINENSNTETKGGKSREVKDDLSKHKDSTDKSSRKSNTDKSSRKSNTDKSSRKSNTDKSSRKSNTDKNSRKSNTDKSSRKSNTDKNSRKSNTDKSSKKSNTDKSSRKSNTDKGNRKNIVKRFVNDKVRKNTDKSNRKNSATKDNGKGNTNENDDDESYASESDYESNASESDDKSNAAKEDDENDASEGDNESNASESDDKSNAAKEDDENDASEGDNESNASESDDKSNAAEEDDENNATGESKAKSNSKGSTAEGYGKIKHRSSRKNNNKVKSNGKNGAANDNGKSNNAKDDDENNTTGNYNCLQS
ncbi:unnamed protein product [Rhizophagus irregularis]|nr:unnamed protein product [Rhizophagus irregularis]